MRVVGGGRRSAFVAGPRNGGGHTLYCTMRRATWVVSARPAHTPSATDLPGGGQPNQYTVGRSAEGEGGRGRHTGHLQTWPRRSDRAWTRARPTRPSPMRSVRPLARRPPFPPRSPLSPLAPPCSLSLSRALVVYAVMRAFSRAFCRRFPRWNPTVGALTKGRWVRARGLGAGAVAAGLAARVQQNAEAVLLLSPRDEPVVFRAARRDGPLHKRARRPRSDVQRAHEHRPGAAHNDPGRVPALAEAGARPRSACARGRAHNRENSAAVPASLLVSRFRRR